MLWGVVILAAGRSSRMGSPKLLLEWCGRSLLRRAVEAASMAHAAEVVVVVGEYAERLVQEVPPELARAVANPDFARGQSTSLRSGLAALSKDVTGAVVYPADQPFVTAEVIGRLVAGHVASGFPLVVSEVKGVRGAPMFLARPVFEDAMRIEGDRGARELLSSRPELVHVVHFDDPDLMIDVDTPEEYQELLARSASKPHPDLLWEGEGESGGKSPFSVEEG